MLSGNIKKVVGENVIKILDNEYDLQAVLLVENLSDIGMDSLNYMNLIVKLEMDFNIEFQDDILNPEKYNSVIKISEYIQNMLTNN